MTRTESLLITMLLACSSLLAQGDQPATLHDGLIDEQHGHFDAAIKTIKLAIDSNQLNGIELGRAYIMFGIAYHQEGKFTEANAAFEHSLRLLEHDPEHQSDYAEALNNYGGLVADAGQFEGARAMWLKALHLRQQMGDHAGAMRSLTDLGQLALARKRIREAKRYIQQASEEMELAQELADDEFTVFLETRGKLALAEGHAPAALENFQRALELCERTRGNEHWLTGWEHILRGKAYAQAGDLSDAANDMAEGLAIIDRALGRKSLNYLAAVMVYSQVLDRTGSHAEAARLRATAEETTKDLYQSQCLGCTINITGFR
jgi:tetratricopeptide (TPR) repeat protein